MSRQLAGHTGPHATYADKRCAPSMLAGSVGHQAARKTIKKAHNKKARRWAREGVRGIGKAEL